MPVYRSERYLGDAIRSVLAQTFTDFELIVVDDASPDATYEVARAIADPRLTVVRNDRNLGPEGNWNRALGAASGSYIKLLPGDDLLYPTCLERQVAVLEDDANASVVLVCSSRDIVDRCGRRLLRPRFPGSGRVRGERLIGRSIRYGTNIIGEPGAVLFRAQAAQRAGQFDASLGFVTDLDYWARLLRHGDAYVIPEALCSFRLSGDNWSVELGRRRCAQYLQLIDRLTEHNYPISRLDRVVGRAMARLNELLRRAFYRRLPGVRAEKAA